MPKRVVLIGHCGPDSSYLRMAVSRAQKDVRVTTADEAAELDRVIAEGADLLLFNRVLDYGFPEDEGIDVIRRLRSAHPELKMMLVSNYPEAQAAAIAAGALPGFGKRDIGSAVATDRIREALATPSPSSKGTV